MADGKRPPRYQYQNQKQLRLGQDPEAMPHLSGDASTDDRVDDEGPVQEPHNALTMHRRLGGIFMHPMHDASADPHLEHAEEISPSD